LSIPNPPAGRKTSDAPEILVSVLLPARDAGSTLDSALRSVRGQRGLADELEILVLDDGSRDRTVSVAQSHRRRDPRVRVFRLPPRGISSALNTGLEEARGRYIARMDADDLSHPERLVRQLRHLRRHPGLDVVGTRVRLFPRRLVSPRMAAYIRWQNRWLIHRALEAQLLVECPLTHPTAVFRREALERVGGWLASQDPEDYDLWLRGATLGWRLGKVNRVLYGWREHDRRLTRRASRFSREAFRHLAARTFVRVFPSRVPVLLWGWGSSHRFWVRALREAGFAIEARAVDPRAVRRGDLPSIPALRDLRARPLAGPAEGPEIYWLLAYGADRSRETLGERLADLGCRSGLHYRFVS
jgi:glycosyltransferase involved in cell wall biosynthesis